MAYLDQEDDEEVEIGDSSELLEQIFGDEVPYGVLGETHGGRTIDHLRGFSLTKNVCVYVCVCV